MMINNSSRYEATDALAKVISEQGRTKRWVGQQAGVSESLINKIVKRRRTASEEVANEIARALGLPLFLIFDSHQRVEITQTGSPR